MCQGEEIENEREKESVGDRKKIQGFISILYSLDLAWDLSVVGDTWYFELVFYCSLLSLGEWLNSV